MNDMNRLNRMLPPNNGWFQRNRLVRMSGAAQDVVHEVRLRNEMLIIQEEADYIAQAINDVLRARDPHVDVLRRAGERITFAMRRLKFEFDQYAALHAQAKVRAHEYASIVREAGGATAAATFVDVGTSTDSSSSSDDYYYRDSTTQSDQSN